MPKIIASIGEKGGVGKPPIPFSMVVNGFIYLLRKVASYESDRSNADFFALGKNMASRWAIFFSESKTFIDSANEVYK